MDIHEDNETHHIKWHWEHFLSFRLVPSHLPVSIARLQLPVLNRIYELLISLAKLSSVFSNENALLKEKKIVDFEGKVEQPNQFCIY